MLDFELEELNQATDWREVLAAYLNAHQAAHAAAKNTEEGFDGWLPRIMAVDGLEAEDLPRIHGKLIALGFLKFQLASRGTGVVYQISPAGRQALNDIVPDDIDSDEDDYDGSHDEDETPQNEERVQRESSSLEDEVEASYDEEAPEVEGSWQTGDEETSDEAERTQQIEEVAAGDEEIAETLRNATLAQIEEAEEIDEQEAASQTDDEIEEADQAA